MQSTAQVQAGGVATDECKGRSRGQGCGHRWVQEAEAGMRIKAFGRTFGRGRGRRRARGTVVGLTRCRLLRWLWSTCQLSLSSKLKARANVG